VLGVVLASVGLSGSPGAQAQEPSDPSAAFGGFDASARANGLQLTYDVENVFPLPSPLFQASVPESRTTLQSGPAATALGSIAYPGNVLANLPAIVAQGGGGEAGQLVPGYPVVSRAEHPGGPPEARQTVGAANSEARANETFAQAVTTMGGGDLPAFVRIGAVTTSARTGFVDGKIESRSRVEVTAVDLLFGLLHIDSIVTDLVATTDGATSASDGGTTFSGITFLGLPATLGPDGLVVGEPSAPANPGPLTPLVEGVGDLTPVADGLRDAAEPLNQALRDVLGSTNATVADLLEASGIRIRTLEPFESVQGPSAERTANGVVIDITYDGRGDNPLAQLVAAIPSDQLPGEGIPGFPVNTSPQALVNLLKETHVTGLALAYGNVNVDATPAFEFDAPDFDAPDLSSPIGGAGGPLATPGFSTPSPQLPPGGPGTGPGDLGVDGTPAAAAGAGAGAAAVLLALLSSPLWAVGSRNLADNVLGVAGSSCPAGLDQPLKGG
jgi:hypothetical protein